MTTVRLLGFRIGAAILCVGLVVSKGSAQTPVPTNSAMPASAPGTSAPAAATPAIVAPPPDYLIGPDDVLSIVFWKDKEMSMDVVVRPDGKISLPQINDVQAAGLTPEQLREGVLAAAAKFYVDPSVNVVVKEIHSRKFFITGEVGKPAAYALTGKLTVVQAIALAGGLNEFAKSDEIAVIRTENGKTTRFLVNYKDITKGKNLQQNIELHVGDTVAVP